MIVSPVGDVSDERLFVCSPSIWKRPSSRPTQRPRMQAQLPPLVLKTPPFSHYGLAWSPFHNQRIALSSAANYGLVGNGRLHLASVAGGQIVLDKTLVS